MTQQQRDTLMDDSAAVLRMIIAQLRELEGSVRRVETPTQDMMNVLPNPIGLR